MDILEKLENKILTAINSVESLQLENLQLEEDLAAKKTELDAQQQQLNDTANQLVEADTERLSLQQQLTEQAHLLEKLSRDLEQANGELENTREALAQSQDDNENLNFEQQRLQQETIELIEAKHQLGSQLQQQQQDNERLSQEKDRLQSKASAILELLDRADLESLTDEAASQDHSSDANSNAA